MLKIPLVKNFSSTTILKAFILNAITAALITTISIEVRLYLDRTNNELIEKMQERNKFILTILTTFLTSFIVYNILYITFSYGKGMVANGKNYKY